MVPTWEKLSVMSFLAAEVTETEYEVEIVSPALFWASLLALLHE
jgi:hypothetical protein